MKTDPHTAKGGHLEPLQGSVKLWQNTGLDNQPGTKQIKIYGEKLPVKVGWKQCWGKKIDGRGGAVWEDERENNEDKYSLTLITFRERDELKFTKKVTLQIQMIVILFVHYTLPFRSLG